MGNNATVIVLTDALEEIKTDQDFGRKLAEAIERSSMNVGRVDVSAGNHCNAASVAEVHHADISRLVLVGGNLGRVVDNVSFPWRTDPKDAQSRQDILERLAGAWGYTVTPKKEAV